MRTPEGRPMSCDVAQRRLSLAADGETTPQSLDGPLRAHVRACRRCASFAETVDDLRHQLRVERLDGAPDVTGAVLDALVAGSGRRPRRRDRRVGLVRAAAVFVVGGLAGATVVAITDDGSPPAAAAPISALVRAAQHRVSSLAATVEIVERGWHPEVGERTFTGTLRYDAPESLALVLEDTTDYPPGDWKPNDVRLVVDDDRWWSAGRRDCPAAAQPACTPDAADVVAVERREPFASSEPVPLELVTPVTSFALADSAAVDGTRIIDGHDALGTMTTAAQVSGVIEGLRPAGNLRRAHPSDTVELWLDAGSLVPLRITVRATDSPDRERWAANRGYDDEPGVTVLEVRLTDLAVNAGLPPGSFPAAPADARVTDGGFTDTPSADGSSTEGGVTEGGATGRGGPDGRELAPVDLPRELRPHRSGTIATSDNLGGTDGIVTVRTWTDGRAWLELRSTTEWDGDRLFGELGPLVRPVDLGDAGIAYVSEGGSRVGLHARGIDVVVVGSVDPAELREVAASLGVTGQPVPPGWVEAATTDLASVRRARPALLAPPTPDGFAPPAVRRDAEVVTMAYTGPGERGFLVVADGTATLLPPTDPDVIGVRVRGRDGRWNPGAGALEWVEDATAYALASRTLALGELLAIAASMEPAE